MIESHIQHFLTPEGIDYFPLWFAHTKEVLEGIDGFLSIKYQTNRAQGRVELWVRFKNDALRQEWATSERHTSIVNELNPFRTASYTVAKREILDEI